MTSDEAFQAALSDAARRTEASLDALLPPASDGRVQEAMRYGALNGGKRLRAFLVLEGSKLFNVPDGQAERAAAAIECVHAYSLVHDDLPAMDDDDLRRGKPTVHRKWDDATAILAGDGLLTHAFEILAHAHTSQDAQIRVRLVSRLAEAAGANGMVGGQDLDLLAEARGAPLSVEEITDLQAKKTGALIGWAAEAGAILGKSNATQMMTYAENLGLAFQIQDDILDLVGDQKITGKRVRKDKSAGKATFVSLLGLGAARELCSKLVEDACAALGPYHGAADNLRALANFVITRTK